MLPVHALDILIIIDHLWMHLMLKDKLQLSRTMDNDQTTSIVVLSNIHHNLNHNPTLNAVVDEDGDDNAADDEKRQSTFYIRILDHLYIACPVISTFVLRKSIDVVSVISVGHLGPHYLAAAGLASVTANVTGNSMIIGLAGALTTICSQAYGSKDYKEMSDSLQRSVLILYVVICLPVSVLWMFSQPIMLLLGQPEAIARDAQRYLVCLIPNLWLLSTSFCIQNWLHAQSKARGIAMISLFLAVLHPIWLYLFIFKFEFGFIGAALAISSTKLLELILLVLYMTVFSDALVENHFHWSTDCFRHWGTYLKLGVPSLIMMTEWWASEIIIFMSGSLPDGELTMSVMSIYQNIIAMCFMAPAAFNTSAATIVGNALGEGNATKAKSSSFIAPALTLLSSLSISVCILSLRHELGRVFTDDGNVIAMVSTLSPLIVAYIISDGCQTSLTGVIKGMGKQGIASPIVLVSYYCVGIPLSSYLAMDWGLGWGVFGLCTGTLIGTIVHMLSFMVFVYGCTDWEKEVQRVRLLQLTDTDENSSIVTTIDSTPITKGVFGDDDEDDSWWDEISFIRKPSSDTVAVSRDGSSSWIGGVYSTMRNIFTGKKGATGEYELVKTYTDSLNPIHMHDDDGLEEIDFEFI